MEKDFFGFPLVPINEAEERLKAKATRGIAYFSMEFGLAPSFYNTFKPGAKVSPLNISTGHEVFSNMKDMDYYHLLPVKNLIDLPIYSGGLGVLAGDALKSSEDLGLPLAGIGILWHKGYFHQKFWFRSGGQIPEETTWDPDSYPGLIRLKPTVEITLSGQKLILNLWKYYVFSYDRKKVVPLILLDANTDENPEYFRELTDQLYRSTNNWIKIAQRMILGIGGVKALDTLGYSIATYHLNEGHAAFAAVEKREGTFSYTCHTPVEAGHDRFDLQELEAALGKDGTDFIRKYGRDEKHHNLANLTVLALNRSGKANTVSKKHNDVTHLQFPNHKTKIDNVTNGVHTFTWISEPISNLLKKYKEKIGDWEANPKLLLKTEYLKNDPEFRKELWQAHLKNKEHLAKLLKHWFFEKDVFTIAWARRIAIYKRPGLLLEETSHLIDIAKKYGPLQIVIAGKAHPADVPASLHMDQMLEKINFLNGERKYLRICFLENYDTSFARFLTGSVDVWLNNPLPPFEASGTSGMKAIVNGVLQLSTLDGWIVEAADKNIGKIFGYTPKEGEIGQETNLRLKEDSKELYKNLDDLVHLYYGTAEGKISLNESGWIDMMINCISQAGVFNTHRMIEEYNEKIW